MAAEKPDPSAEIVLQGIGVSPGVAVGEAVVFALEGTACIERDISESDIPLEIARFEEALTKTRRQLAELQRKVDEALGAEHASIFDAHLLVVDDRYFVEEVIRELHDRRKNVEAVLDVVTERYMKVLQNVEDDYLRERAADVRDVTRRILKNLSGETPDRMDQIERPCIAVAHDFSPSDTAGMNREKVHAMVADVGSPTSHTAIMARALEVPAVVGLHDITARLAVGDTLLVDGTKGLIIIHPSSERLLSYARRAEEQKVFLCELDELKDKPSETLDGYCMPIGANIELPAEVEGIARYGAKGIGLFRTEFLFLDKETPPTEEEQTEVYCRVAEQCAPDPVVIRTVDLGGDKFSSILKMPPELNPFLGWRAIRFCLANPEFFKTQLRAILRASVHGNIRVMYPMISGLTEVLEAGRILDQCKDELQTIGVPFDEDIQAGVMIEVPSAALIAELIAPHVDFFSIGTNDLLQYTLAVDRVNENVAHLYKPTHIAMLKLIQRVVREAHRHGIPAAVCGQMAASPELVPLLIGLGVDELSISPPSVPMVKDVIRRVRYSQCIELASEALCRATAAEALALCHALLAKTAPEILELVE